jgi:hypothetical protein
VIVEQLQFNNVEMDQLFLLLLAEIMQNQLVKQDVTLNQLVIVQLKLLESAEVLELSFKLNAEQKKKQTVNKDVEREIHVMEKYVMIMLHVLLILVMQLLEIVFSLILMKNVTIIINVLSIDAHQPDAVTLKLFVTMEMLAQMMFVTLELDNAFKL